MEAPTSSNSDQPTVPKKSRKERRIQWWLEHQEQQETPASAAASEPNAKKRPQNLESADALPPSQTKTSKSASKQSVKKFYVLFVGQIPYSATTEDITKHFSKAGDVKSVRLATDKKTGKSRGFAYVEFSNNKAYMNGLNMHLSKINGRPINVEITSPGRGTSLFRKENLKRKNEEMARFRGIKQDTAAGGAMRIPAGGRQPAKKKKFTKTER